MLDEQIAHSNFDLGKIGGDCFLDVASDQMTTTGRSGDRDFVLKPKRSFGRHAGRAFGGRSRLTGAGKGRLWTGS